jgi:hypothetical protein
VEVLLDAKRPVPVEHVDVRLQGEERVVSQRQRFQRPLLSLRGRLREGEPPLPAGETRLSLHFDLPADAPPSYAGSAATVAYTVAVRAAIPWWPDARESFVLAVCPRPQHREAAKGRVYTTAERGPRGKEPHLEFTLTSDAVVPGASLRGQVALYNVAYERYQLLALSLVGKETLRSGRGGALGVVESHRLTARYPLEEVSEGEPIDFALKLPETLPPSHASALWSLAWSFELEAQVAWSANVTASVPIDVLPSGSEGPPSSGYAVPTIGSPRIAAIWTAVASAHGLAFEPDRGTIRGQVGEVVVHVKREHRGGDGIFLVAQLSYPSLGLDLDGGLASGFRRVIGGGVAIGKADWDARHYLTGREGAQVEQFLLGIGPLLAAHELADIEDEQLMIQLRDGGQTREPLERLVRDARALAERIPAARAEVPPPAAMAELVPEWERMARALDCALQHTCMAVSGRHGGVPCSVTTRWTPRGATLRTEIALEAVESIEDRHQLRLSAREPPDAAAVEELPPRARALLETLAGVPALSIEREQLVLWERAPLEAKLVLERLEQLAALSTALRGPRGPYR